MRVAVNAAVADTGKVGKTFEALAPLRRADRRLQLRWAGRLRRRRPDLWIAAGFTLLLLTFLVLAILEMATPVDSLTTLDERCKDHEFACATDAGVVFALFVWIGSFARDALWGMWWTVNLGYSRLVRRGPSDVVPTAGDVSSVVGRDDLCRIVERNIGASKRPQVIVGDVGAGKTAVLVRLMERLAQGGAVPLAVRAIDLREDDDFASLAKRGFDAVTKTGGRAAANPERMWDRLIKEGLVVVLVDGLEEALVVADDRQERIQRALVQARHARLPVVAASRPDEALSTFDASLIELDPIDDEAAVEYVRGGWLKKARPGDEQRGLRTIVATARVTEMPFYLDLMQKLHAHELLGRVGEEGRSLREAGRLTLRLRMLDEWRKALVRGVLVDDPSLTADERDGAVRGLSAVAAVALIDDAFQVQVGSLAESPYLKDEGMTPQAVRGLANTGARIGLVQTSGGTIRFRHSIVEAYLGALWIRDRRASLNGYVEHGLRDGGREFLMALVMACGLIRENPGVAGCAWLKDVRKRVSRAVESTDRPDWSVALLAAAYEIDAMLVGEPAHGLRRRLKRHWPVDNPRQGARLEEAKRQAIERIAECRHPEGYAALYDLCERDQGYRIRLAGAQHLGAGGDAAIAGIGDRLEAVLAEARRLKADDFKGTDGPHERAACLQGWILPMLVGSSEGSRQRMRQLLDDWLEVSKGAPAYYDGCLAQGFKYEANIRPWPTEDRAPRFLVDRADDLLGRTAFWYARMSLLHAMCLRSLPTGRLQRREIKHRFDKWREGDQHPFVRAAAELCVKVVDAQDPAPFIWIDETGVVSKVGQRWSRDSYWTPRLWLTESRGWASLDPRALRLVADVVLLLNLTDGDAERRAPALHLTRLGKACATDVPPCLANAFRDTCELREDDRRTGSLPAVECDFKFCPYPVAGTSLRPDFSQAFARRVAALPAFAEWHDVRHRDLRMFWDKMESRARN